MTVYRSDNKIMFNTEILATPLQKKTVLLDTLTLVDTSPTQDAEDLGEERWTYWQSGKTNKYGTRWRHYCMTPTAVSMALHPFCADNMCKVPLLVETHQQLLIRRLAADVVIITCGLQDALWPFQFFTQMLHWLCTHRDAHIHTHTHTKVSQEDLIRIKLFRLKN